MKEEQVRQISGIAVVILLILLGAAILFCGAYLMGYAAGYKDKKNEDGEEEYRRMFDFEKKD